MVMKKIFDHVVIEGYPTMEISAAMDVDDLSNGKVVIRCKQRFDKSDPIMAKAFPDAELALDFKSACKACDTLKKVLSTPNRASANELLSNDPFKPMWPYRRVMFNRFAIPYMIYALTVFTEYELPNGVKPETELDTEYLSTVIGVLDDCTNAVFDLLIDCSHDIDFIQHTLDQAIIELSDKFDRMGNYIDLFPAESVCLEILSLAKGWTCYDDGIPEYEIEKIRNHFDTLYWIRTTLLVQLMDRKYQLAFNEE